MRIKHWNGERTSLSEKQKKWRERSKRNEERSKKNEKHWKLTKRKILRGKHLKLCIAVGNSLSVDEIEVRRGAFHMTEHQCFEMRKHTSDVIV